MNYKKAIAYLESLINLEKDRKLLTSSESYKLERTRRMLDYFNSPDKDYRIFHVAGTNGKGSVSTFFYTLMHNNKIKAGLFTSPHILDVRERIIANGNYIPKKAFAKLVSLIKEYADKHNDKPTYFEAFTVMAAIHFRKAGCKIGVFETGIGGLLDATNALKSELCAITSISLDHTAVLGSDIKDIAFQKAGIIKENTPVLLGNIEKKAKDVILSVAAKKNAPVFTFGKDFNAASPLLSLSGTDFTYLPGNIRMQCPKTGCSSAYNASIAHFGAKMIFSGITPDLRLKKGLLSARFDIINKKYPVVLDGSHNIAAIMNLTKTLRSLTNQDKFHFLLGFLKDKDYKTIIDFLAPFIKTLSIAKIDFTSDASKEAFSYAEEKLLNPIYFEDPLKYPKYIKTFERLPVVVTGSFYLCSDIYKKLKSFKKAF